MCNFCKGWAMAYVCFVCKICLVYVKLWLFFFVVYNESNNYLFSLKANFHVTIIKKNNFVLNLSSQP